MDASAPVRRTWRDHRFRLATMVYGPGVTAPAFTFIGEERIAVGSLPTPSSLIALREAGITDVINCRARPQHAFSGDLDTERRLFGPDHVRAAPMWDHGRPQDPALWAGAALWGARVLDDPGARLLVHCQRGRRRSVLVTYAILRLRGHTGEEAAKAILSHRTEGRVVPAYRLSVERWLAETGHGAEAA
jgi:protein-tyrosine phosphatase